MLKRLTVSVVSVRPSASCVLCATIAADAVLLIEASTCSALRALACDSVTTCHKYEHRESLSTRTLTRVEAVLSRRESRILVRGAQQSCDPRGGA